LTTGAPWGIVTPEAPATAPWRRCCRVARTGVAAQLDTRRPASYGHPRCRATATCAPDPGHCEPPGGRRDNSSVRGCEATSPAAHSSPADRRREREKSLCCVTTRRRNLWVFNGLGRSLGLLTARTLCLGVLGSGEGVLAMSGLPTRRLPASDFSLALWLLAVALVPAPRLVLASTPFAEAGPRAWSPRSGPTAVLSRNVAGAHGSLNLPREKLGEDVSASSSGVIKTRMRRSPTSLSPSTERDRERNGFRNALGRRHQDR
jgi:hypothetical protein